MIKIIIGIIFLLMNSRIDVKLKLYIISKFNVNVHNVHKLK